ncbi:hypothetical protein PAPYR_7773 [Paratrimastix pyriformis]|uniref:RanBD1 domain-containing protein n=1 Tax=Paratrimastix pyriformis TaxID=342808 RepID=A0ABQ8UEI1_9EUKA|nr:hypothetical protein PAPYR_7773 [Paratrimastix pyriformis]
MTPIALSDRIRRGSLLLYKSHRNRFQAVSFGPDKRLPPAHQFRSRAGGFSLPSTKADYFDAVWVFVRLRYRMSGKKRIAEKQITRDEPDSSEADHPHVAGAFQEAPPEVLATRKIAKARTRKGAMKAAAPEAAPKNPFADAAPKNPFAEAAKNPFLAAAAAAAAAAPTPAAGADAPKAEEKKPESVAKDAPVTTTTTTTTSTTTPSSPPSIFNPAAAKPFPFPFKVSAATAAAPAANPFGAFTFSASPPPPAGGAPQFHFALGGNLPAADKAASFGAPVTAPAAGEEENPEAFQPKEDAATAPKQPLVPEQKVESGEEGESTLWKGNAKLLELVTVEGKPSFKERGVGELRLNRPAAKEGEQAGKPRLLMRTTGTLRVILNVVLNPTSVGCGLVGCGVVVCGCAVVLNPTVKLSRANPTSLRVVTLEPNPEDADHPKVATHVVRLPQADQMDLLAHAMTADCGVAVAPLPAKKD